jgi:hypothetical protein
MITITKLAINPGGVASLDESGEDLKFCLRANKSSLLPHFSKLKRFGI